MLGVFLCLLGRALLPLRLSTVALLPLRSSTVALTLDHCCPYARALLPLRSSTVANTLEHCCPYAQALLPLAAARRTWSSDYYLVDHRRHRFAQSAVYRRPRRVLRHMHTFYMSRSCNFLVHVMWPTDWFTPYSTRPSTALPLLKFVEPLILNTRETDSECWFRFRLISCQPTNVFISAILYRLISIEEDNYYDVKLMSS